MIQTITFTAGQTREFLEVGDFFRYLEGVGPISVTYYKAGREITDAESIKPGYGEQFKGGDFDRIQVTSATEQTVQIVTRYGSTVQYDAPPTGNVNVTNVPGVTIENVPAVTVSNVPAVTIANVPGVTIDNVPAVTLSGEQGAFTQAAATVTNVSGQLLAAKANRRYLLIQNNNASGGAIYVNLAGAAAAIAGGISIEAGTAYECANFCPTAAIFAIGSIASNANITVVEG